MNVTKNTQLTSTSVNYAHDGAAVVRGVIGPDRLESLRRAVDEVMSNPASTATDYRSGDGEGRFFGDFFMWRHNVAFDDLIRCPEIVELAATFMDSDEVYFFYDQLFVKEPNTDQPTPVHQDLPYWPISGNQIISLWVPLDPVTVDSGAVHYVSGSHSWGKTYAPQAFSEDSDFSKQYAEMNLLPPPDLDELVSEHQCIVWDTQPGDVVAHHPLTLHYAPGNSTSNTRRRAIALRYVGKDVRYDDRPGTFIRNPKLESISAEIKLSDGELLRGSLFPRVWP